MGHQSQEGCESISAHPCHFLAQYVDPLLFSSKSTWKTEGVNFLNALLLSLGCFPYWSYITFTDLKLDVPAWGQILLLISIVPYLTLLVSFFFLLQWFNRQVFTSCRALSTFVTSCRQHETVIHVNSALSMRNTAFWALEDLLYRCSGSYWIMRTTFVKIFIGGSLSNLSIINIQAKITDSYGSFDQGPE